MKKPILLSAAVLLCFTMVFSQGCLPDGITLSTQAQIDNFQINYPGCTEIGGGVFISGSDITNLNGLNILTSIGGDFYIGYWYGGNPVLTSLTGLGNLTSIGGDFYIGYWSNGNPILTGLAGLENLTSIGGDLSIIDNDALTSLSALDNVVPDSITGLYIFENYHLSTCEVQSICNYLASPNGTVEIINNFAGCNNSGEVQAACPAGVENNDFDKGFSSFPNPSSTFITIESLSIPTLCQISILNMNGQEVLKQTINEPITFIDVRSLPGGVYILALMTDYNRAVKKLVKQ